MLWGAQCAPPPAPVCEIGDSCPPGQIAECAGQCGDAATAGEQCNLDPCSATFELCAYNHTCVQGVCVRNVDLPSADILFCRPRSASSTALTECPTGTYCHLFGPSYPRPAWAPAGTRGTCSTPINEGNVCEGDWAPWTQDDACDAGLRCVTDPRDPSRRACFRGCADAANDCACSSPNPSVLDDCVTNVPETIGSEPGLCAHCVENGGELESGGWDCCDDQATGSDAVCCRPDAAACQLDTDCCPNAVSGARASTCASGICTPCNIEGEAVDMKGPGCCFGDPYPTSGVCPVTCFIGTQEVVDGSLCCGQGTVVCQPDNTGECVGAPQEVFDCEDNDCNGLTDDGLPPSAQDCEAVVEGSGAFQGCENLGELPGRYDCSTGELVCRVSTGYCAWDRDGNPIDRAPMGAECFRLGSDCSTSECSAGEWCCSSNSEGPYCDRIGRIMQDGASEPILNLDPPMDCWRPGELNDDLECPYEDSLCTGLVCGDCLEESGCGFCNSVCLAGDAMGPSGGLHCDPGDWLYGDAELPLCP